MDTRSWGNAKDFIIDTLTMRGGFHYQTATHVPWFILRKEKQGKKIGNLFDATKIKPMISL